MISFQKTDKISFLKKWYLPLSFQLILFVNFFTLIFSYVFQKTLTPLLNNKTFFHFIGLTPQCISNLYLWQLLTYTFVNNNFLSFIINMLVLFFAITYLHHFWSETKIIIIYCTTGILPAIAFLFFNLHPIYNNSSISTTAFLIVWLYYNWNNSVIKQIKMKHIVLIFIFLYLILQNDSFQTTSLIIKIMATILNALFILLVSSLLSIIYTSYTHTIQTKNQIKLIEMKKKADEILEKISKNGINSLSQEEKKLLQKVSQFYRNKKKY